MKRDLKAFDARAFDLLVIGGGITGACIARDAQLRGLSVALVEAKDFSHATSAATSKLVHGGLRYLKSLEFGLVRESLAERRIWERIAPHLVFPLPFMLPVRACERLMLGLGLSLYDLLAFDRNWLADKDKHLPAHRWLEPDQALALEPGLPREKLAGAYVYYDCQMPHPERLGLECVLDAAAAGAVIANYAEVVGFEHAATHDDPRRVTGAVIADGLTGQRHSVRASVTVNATGPWADLLLDLSDGPTAGGPVLMRSKGLHLVTRPITRGHALALQTPRGHLFVMPWRGHTLIGTTDTVFEGRPETLGLDRDEIVAFLDDVNRALPDAVLTLSDVVYAYAGLRPLVAEPGAMNSYGVSRKAEVIDHAERGGPNGLISAVGGKWTTSRKLAERVVTRVVKKLGRGPLRCTTHLRPLPGGRFEDFASFAATSRSRLSMLPQDSARLMAETYGAALPAIADRIADDSALAAPVAPGRAEIMAQVDYGVEVEMARMLDDIVLRRTGLGTLGFPGASALGAIARRMARYLDWDEVEIARQTGLTVARFQAFGVDTDRSRADQDV